MGDKPTDGGEAFVRWKNTRKIELLGLQKEAGYSAPTPSTASGLDAWAAEMTKAELEAAKRLKGQQQPASLAEAWPRTRSVITGRDATDYGQLVLSALIKHHQPDDDWRSCNNWNAAKQVELISNLKIDRKHKGRVSEQIKRLFGSQAEYGRMCFRKSDDLLRILRRESGEVPEATGNADRIDGITGSNRESDRYSPDVTDLLLDRESS